MINKDGSMFHVDFGFIFGRNPPKKQLFSTEIRINKNMINAMGGPKSPNYITFKSKCITAFMILR
jgi:phosphatidylinositol 3-kinase